MIEKKIEKLKSVSGKKSQQCFKHFGNSLLSRFGLVVRSHRPAARVDAASLSGCDCALHCGEREAGTGGWPNKFNLEPPFEMVFPSL